MKMRPGVFVEFGGWEARSHDQESLG